VPPISITDNYDRLYVMSTRDFAAQHGAEVNTNGGFYIRGKAHSIMKKMHVAEKYIQAKNRGEQRPNHTRIAQQCQVSRGFVSKIETEILSNGQQILTPEEIRAATDRPCLPGANSLTDLDRFILVLLLEEKPYRLLRNYQQWLLYFTGTNVSTETISRFLKQGLPHKGSLVKPNLIPLDKFKIENEIRAYEFLNVLRTLKTWKVIFGDEKSLKGEEFYSKRVRRNPVTGMVASILTGADFRNKYSITGFCSINSDKSVPVWFRIHKQSNDANEFMSTIKIAVEEDYFDEYDVLVLDNAAIHDEEMVRWLWETKKVLVLFLPTRSPEFNPIELIWRHLVSRLFSYPIDEAQRKYPSTSDLPALVSRDILEEVTFDIVEKCFKKCFALSQRN